jgi:Tol biopolymer transport system component
MDIFLRHGLSAPPSRWTPDNHILFISGDSNVWRIPLEAGSWKTQDRPQQLTSGTGQVNSFASLPDGRLVFDDRRGSANLWSLPVDAAKGKVTGAPQQITQDEAFAFPSLSADGDKLVYGSTRAGWVTLWFRDLNTGREVMLADRHSGGWPMISRDGKVVVFSEDEAQSSPNGSSSLFLMPVNGGTAEKLIEGEQLAPNGWLFTQNKMLFQSGDNGGDGSPQVLLLDIATRKQQLVLEHNEYKLSEIYPSPDDRWISFVAIRQGLKRVFIAPLHSDRAAPESEWVAVTDWSSCYENEPRWSPSGNLLYFISARDGPNCIWAQLLDPVSKRPIGGAFAVYHLHDARLNLARITSVPGRIVFAREEETGSIWLAEPQ